MSRRRAQRTIVVVASLGALVSCAGGPSGRAADEDRAEEVRATTLEIAADAVGLATDLYPQLELRRPAEKDDSWYDCSATATPAVPGDGRTPARLQWIADRALDAEPEEPTQPMLDAVIAELRAAGWEVGHDRTHENYRRTALDRGGFTVALSGSVEVGDQAWLGVTVTSPCVDGPAAAPTSSRR